MDIGTRIQHLPPTWNLQAKLMQRIKSRSNFRRLVGNTCFLFYLQKWPVCFWLTVEGKPAAALYWNALLPVPCSLTTHHKQQQKKKTSKAVSLRGESETQEKFVYSSPGRHGDYRRLGEAERREKLCNLCQIWERGRHETIWKIFRHHMERANNNILLVPMGLLLEGLSFF